jgi:hypothetical protein
MANRKYLFFAEVAKLFRDTAAHFRLFHVELLIEDPANLFSQQKQASFAPYRKP